MEEDDAPGEAQCMLVSEDNPEAIFDLLTLQSLKGRYGGIQTSGQPESRGLVAMEKGFHSETDFETYVLQFPIDDTISQCFAAANSERSDKKQVPLYVSGGKRPDLSNQKQRKKFGRKPAYDINTADDDARSRDPKRSKTGGVFGKRHKWLSNKYEASRSGKKQASSSDQSEASDSVFLSEESKRLYENGLRNDSNSTSDSQITSFSEVFMRNHDDQVVPYLAGNLGATSTLKGTSPGTRSNAEGDTANDRITAVLKGDSHDMIHQLEDLSPDEARSLRDHHGNTLLHCCVMAGSEDGVKYLLEKYPEMASDINTDNLTAVELAAKTLTCRHVSDVAAGLGLHCMICPSAPFRVTLPIYLLKTAKWFKYLQMSLYRFQKKIGNYDCLKVILERNQRRKSNSPSLINRLLTISAQHGQVGCLSLLLQRLTSDPHGPQELPRDPRGNTAAHLAAKHGHLSCLQTLVAAGFDVSSENILGQRPLHVAHQSRQHGCFEYLLLLHVAHDLITVLQQTDARGARSDAPLTSSLTESILTCFRHFNELFIETQQMLSDCKVSIMQTLAKLQNDLDLFIKHTATDSATKRKAAREKLDELTSQIEQLEDTLEFSPLLEKEGAMTRLLASVNADIAKARDVSVSSPADRGQALSNKQADTALRCIIRDIHKEFLMENWSVDHVYARHLGSAHFPQCLTPQDNIWSRARAPSDNDSSDQPVDTESSDQTDVSYANITSINNDITHDKEKTDVNITEDTGGIHDKAEHTHVTKNNGEINNSYTEKTPESAGTTVETETCDNNVAQTERPFTKLLSLDERIDLLIAGEREREKGSDSETLVSADSIPRAQSGTEGSLYTTTFTSITSDSTSGLSEWYTKLGLTSLETSPEELTGETTSDSASYWWDQGEERQPRWPNGHPSNKGPSVGVDVRQQIQFQLESEEPSYEELRRQRLISHLRSLEQSRYASDNFCERITTSTGEVIGGFGRREDSTTERMVIDVTGALKKRPDSKPALKQRSLSKQKLFTLEDAIATGPQHLSNQKSRKTGSPTMNWEEMSFTDEEEFNNDSWYEMGSRQYRSGASMSDRSTTPQSYV